MKPRQSFKVERVNDEYGRVSSMLVGFREDLDQLAKSVASIGSTDDDEGDADVHVTSRSSSQFWSRSRSPAHSPRDHKATPLSPRPLTSFTPDTFSVHRVRSNNPTDAKTNMKNKRRNSQAKIPHAHSPILRREQSRLLLQEKQEEQERIDAEKLPILGRISGCLQRSAVVYNSSGVVVGTQQGATELSLSFAQMSSIPVGGADDSAASRAARQFTLKDFDDVDQLYESHMTTRDLQKQLNNLMGNSQFTSYISKRQGTTGKANLGYSSHEGQGHPSLLPPLRPHVQQGVGTHSSRSPFAHEVSGSPISFNPDTLERRAGLTKRLLAHQGATSSTSKLLISSYASYPPDSPSPARTISIANHNTFMANDSRGTSHEGGPDEELGLWGFQIEEMSREARRAAIRHVDKKVPAGGIAPLNAQMTRDTSSPPRSGVSTRSGGRMHWVDPTPFRSCIDIVRPGATDFSQAPIPRACRGWEGAYAHSSNGPLGKDQVCNLSSLRHKLERLEEEEVRRAAARAAVIQKREEERQQLEANSHGSDDEELIVGTGTVRQVNSNLGTTSRPSGYGSSKVFKRGAGSGHALMHIPKQASGRFPNGRRRSGRDLKDGSTGEDETAATLRKRKMCGLWTDWTETNFVSARAGVEQEVDSEMVVEEETNMPAQDLHLYQLYCAHQKITIIIRPISNSVVDLYAGTAILDPAFCDDSGNPIPQPNMSAAEVRAATNFECRVKGKSISVSLKSSPFAPIGGLIPVNPALGKAYLDAVKRERDMEDLILNAQGGVMTIALLKRLKAQKAQAGSLTAGFVRDIQQSLLDSNSECSALLAEYQAAVTMTIDKAAVSKRYIDRLNNAQFLGTTHALWHGMPVYYNEAGLDGVERVEEGGCPVFYIRRADGKFYPFSQEHQNVEKNHVILASVTAHFKPVEVVTHRSFVISSVTKRVEEDASSYLIGPDFDGLTYGRNVHFVNSPLKDSPSPYTSHDHIQYADAHSNTNLVVGMGLVYEDDVEHIAELRELTQWKHNHGYECANTVKSQPLTPGPYVLITPTNARVLNTFEEIIGYYRWAWLDGTPLILSPNWKVVILGGLPVPYGEDLTLPIVDDCGYSSFMLDVDTNGLSLVDIKAAYTPMDQRQQDTRDRAAKAASNHLQAFHKAAKTTAIQTAFGTAQRDYTLVQDKKMVAQHFFALRRWQLMPPLFVADDPDYTLGTMTLASEGASVELDEDGALLANSIEHETTSTARDHFSMDSDFEHHRERRIKVLEAEYNRVAAMFDELYPTSTSFTAMLQTFIEPDIDFS